MHKLVLACLLVLPICTTSIADVINLESHSLRIEIEDATGRWILLDKRSGTKWPSVGMANPGIATWLEGNFQKTETLDKTSVRLSCKSGGTVVRHSVRIQKQFRKEDGNYEDTNYYLRDDLPKLILVAQKAFEFIALKESKDAEESIPV